MSVVTDTSTWPFIRWTVTGRLSAEQWTAAEKNRAAIIEAFSRHRDSKDERVLNIHGDMVGDVVYALKDDFGGEHGPFLPTADYRGGAMRGLFALSGPGQGGRNCGT